MDRCASFMNLEAIGQLKVDDNWLKDQKFKNPYLIDNDQELWREVSKLRMKEIIDT